MTTPPPVTAATVTAATVTAATVTAATVAVIGLGTMGAGIAQTFAAAGHLVLMFDGHAETLASAPDRIARALAPLVAKGKLAPDTRDAILSRLIAVETLAALAPATLIIEAITERMQAKTALLTALEDIVPPNAILATNTSSLSVGAMAAPLRHPDRLLDLHFFNPAPVMRLVELIGHPATSALALTTARTLTEGAGKTVIAAPDTPGFLVNRLARPYYGEALAMLEDGTPASVIDAAMLAAGYRLGPFQLIDLIGADINLAATESLYAAMGNHPRYHPFAALRAQVASGHQGAKTGRGFVHPDQVTPLENPMIQSRIEAALINEGLWLVHDSATPPGLIDTALTLGLNLPNGPFALRTRAGAQALYATLAALEASAPPYLRGRYLPPPRSNP